MMKLLGFTQRILTHHSKSQNGFFEKRKRFCSMPDNSASIKKFPTNFLNMKKTFWDNPYQTKLMTSVASVNRNEIVFKETIAYSESGGQESDVATVNGVPILSSRMDKTEPHLIYYTMPDSHALSVGEQVIMEIDWPRRLRLMRLHFAAELVLELVMQHHKPIYPELEKVGAHIAEHKARIDFIFYKNIKVILDSILVEYNSIIEADKPIKTGYSDILNQRRFWEIDNFARVPCGGTHVRSTKEVGKISLKRVNGGNFQGKHVERIEIKLLNDVVNEPPNAFSFNGPA